MLEKLFVAVSCCRGGEIKKRRMEVSVGGCTWGRAVSSLVPVDVSPWHGEERMSCEAGLQCPGDPSEDQLSTSWQGWGCPEHHTWTQCWGTKLQLQRPAAEDMLLRHEC